MNDKPYVAWLIEFQPEVNSPNGVGYLKDIDRDGTFDVILTKDANQALQFTSRIEAENIINDTAFIHAMEHILNKLFVRDHMFNCGATSSEEPETKWECPFCGREMKGLDVFPNEACCGEVGRAQKA